MRFEVTDQLEHVRSSHTCWGCGEYKGNGLLLCWPCHHAEKHANGGTYSAATEEHLLDMNNRLGAIDYLAGGLS
jgi:ribosomal protein L37AE/L43A